ncbi:3-hydroxybutyrate oligomer hydrolase family protein [Anaeromyxobacter diazotrophicus]|uniref:Tannase/feruloyl esterase family alpha/beta hydrolase n=1 Tax=Anaeromyxobacter diazotrophicus TaxID=2590199 RepID=A0A7I9VSL8_9BACT|nr:3-hydroxybutyrate oligomer hydrolase family protein [Anaeromyxobacter diazotrophicus]GEJ59120.1 hypothetical protein AMYX_38610 [Anaeromyxobacter diazotrophicus]
MPHPRLSLSALAFAAVLPSLAAAAPSRCERLVAALSSQLADVTCFESADLTTANASTTPLDNSLPGLPAGAFTPRTDRAVLVAAPPRGTPITRAVPGVQLQARFAGDPTGEARFLLRLPDGWNGRLVVAGASSQRSEFNGDFAWSDYVVQKGYAYASQNKGVFNFKLAAVSATPPADPLPCRLNPGSPVWVHFYDDDPGQPFTRWSEVMLDAAAAARRGVRAHYGEPPRYTYAVGTSNGGYQVRRAVELAPHLFDGGVDWEGTFVDAGAPNLLTDLPPAVLNWPDYLASGKSSTSTAYRNFLAAGYPPDLVSGADSLWTHHWASYWELTECQWQKRLDPSYDTYGAGTAGYNYLARLSASDVGAQLAAIATTGRIQRPLVTVAGTMDALLPIDHHARAYARKVAAGLAERGHGEGEEEGRAPDYRLYEVQNGNHIESYADLFPQLQLVLPHAHAAFDLLVAHVEAGAALPADQCVPPGGAIAGAPAQPGHCAALFAP